MLVPVAVDSPRRYTGAMNAIDERACGKPGCDNFGKPGLNIVGHARASQWRDRFLAAGQAGLKSRATEAVDDDHRRLQAKIGELLMETELLYAKVDQLEAGRPLARRRSTQ